MLEVNLHERAQATERLFRTYCDERAIFISGDGRVSEPVAAALIGFAPGTLKNKRAEGGTPPHYKVGQVSSYRLSELALWVESRRNEH